MAVLRSHKDLVELLCEKGAPVDAANNVGILIVYIGRINFVSKITFDVTVRMEILLYTLLRGRTILTSFNCFFHLVQTATQRTKSAAKIWSF